MRQALNLSLPSQPSPIKGKRLNMSRGQKRTPACRSAGVSDILRQVLLRRQTSADRAGAGKVVISVEPEGASVNHRDEYHIPSWGESTVYVLGLGFDEGLLCPIHSMFSRL